MTVRHYSGFNDSASCFVLAVKNILFVCLLLLLFFCLFGWFLLWMCGGLVVVVVFTNLSVRCVTNGCCCLNLQQRGGLASCPTRFTFPFVCLQP